MDLKKTCQPDISPRQLAPAGSYLVIRVGVRDSAKKCTDRNRSRIHFAFVISFLPTLPLHIRTGISLPVYHSISVLLKDGNVGRPLIPMNGI
jgi:hypothetical protein